VGGAVKGACALAGALVVEAGKDSARMEKESAFRRRSGQAGYARCERESCFGLTCAWTSTRLLSFLPLAVVVGQHKHDRRREATGLDRPSLKGALKATTTPSFIHRGEEEEGENDLRDSPMIFELKSARFIAGDARAQRAGRRGGRADGLRRHLSRCARSSRGNTRGTKKIAPARRVQRGRSSCFR